MHRKFGNPWVYKCISMEYKGPIDLMYHPSNLKIGLCLYKKGTNNKWTYKSFDGRFGNNNCNSFYDIYCRLRCL